MVENKSPLDTKKRQLEELAIRLRDGLQEELKRPLIIEFSGTPKSGKTTCVDAVGKFFRRNGIPVHIVTERASVCPISNKHNLYFNVWTGCTSLAQLLASLEKRSSVVILDRGLFDTLVWLDFLTTWKAVKPGELEVIESFFLLDTWTNLIDIVVALSVDPRVALQREFKDQITDKMGSIMNPDNLADYDRSLRRCLEKYRRTFRILHIDTTDNTTIDGVTKITSEVLSTADLLVDEKIGVVPQSIISRRMSSKAVITKQDEIDSFIKEVLEKMEWVKRTEAEEDLLMVQMVPVAVIRRDSEILVVNIRGEKQGRITNRNSIWAGGHVRNSDRPGGKHIATIFRRCLSRELAEELALRLDYSDISPLPTAIVWDNTKPKSIQHLALVYEYRLGASVPKAKLHLREIWESPAKSLFTRFEPLSERLAEISDWESWSVYYLSNVHNLKFPDEDRQSMMF
jgi:predicted NUDIX family phosphoesterase/thymidylate kinase